MGADLYLFEYPLVVRLGLLAALILFTTVATTRGLQNGILLGMVTGLSNFQLFKNPGLPDLNLDRVVWPIVLLIFLRRWRRGEIEKLPPDGVEYSMLALTACILLSLHVHGSYVGDVQGEEDWQTGNFLWGFALPFLIYFLVRRGVRTGEQVRGFFVGLGLITLYFVFTGVAEVWGLDWLVFPKSILDPERGIHQDKVRGIFLNASHNGLAIAMGLPVLMWLFFTDRGVRRYVWFTVIILAGIPLVYSLQRAVWLGALAMLVVTVWTCWPQRRVMLLGTLVLTAAGSFFIAPDTLVHRLQEKLDDKETVDFRIDVTRASWTMIYDNLVTGVGFNKFQYEIHTYADPGTQLIAVGYSHNTALSIFAELGLMGLLPYLAIFGLLFLKSLNVYLRQPQNRTGVGLLWGATVAYVVAMIALEIRNVLYPNALLFALWGMILGEMYRQSTVHGQNKPQPAIAHFL